MSEPEEITTMSGQKLQLKMSVDYISFSAHTDYQQTSEFIRALKPPHVVGNNTYILSNRTPYYLGDYYCYVFSYVACVSLTHFQSVSVMCVCVNCVRACASVYVTFGMGWGMGGAQIAIATLQVHQDL